MKNKTLKTIEEKELLLKDLSARLPYGVKVLYDSEKNFDSGLICQPSGLTKINGETYITAYHVVDPIGLDEAKPYLRLESSMTKEEYEEYYNISYGMNNIGSKYKYYDLCDWLNAHHFDYRGLIEKGLALEAPKDMYNLKEK